MPRSVSAYVALQHLRYYALMLVFLVGPASLATQTSSALFFALLPLSIVATFSMAVVFLEINLRREFETLQSYGVSLWNVMAPVIVVTSTLQLLASALAVLLARDVPYATFYALVSLGGMALAFAVVFARSRKAWNAATPASFALALLVQVLFATCALSLGAVLGVKV